MTPVEEEVGRSHLPRLGEHWDPEVGVGLETFLGVERGRQTGGVECRQCHFEVRRRRDRRGERARSGPAEPRAEGRHEGRDSADEEKGGDDGSAHVGFVCSMGSLGGGGWRGGGGRPRERRCVTHRRQPYAIFALRNASPLKMAN